MSLTGEQQVQAGREQRSRADGHWDRVRYLLIVGWLLIIVATVLFGERSDSWVNIQGQVASGEVGTIRVAGALPADATGYATVDVHWRHGLWRHAARVVEVRGPGAPSNETLLDGTDVSAVVHTDPGVQLVRSQPGLRVLGEPQHLSDSSLLGWRLPNWLGVAAFALILGGLASLVGGPQPGVPPDGRGSGWCCPGGKHRLPAVLWAGVSAADTAGPDPSPYGRVGIFAGHPIGGGAEHLPFMRSFLRAVTTRASRRAHDN